MAQRLVRRLCSCCEKATPTSEYIRKLETIDVPDLDSFTYEYKPLGCPSCENTGFKGRVGIYELLLVEGQTRDAIHSAARGEEIHSIARSAGFRTMQEDAIEKIKTGMTSLQEVQRVVPFDSVTIQRCESCFREVMASFVYCPFCAAVRGNVERPLALR